MGGARSGGLPGAPPERRIAPVHRPTVVPGQGGALGQDDLLDTIRRYGVIIDQRNGQVLPRTTRQFREMLQHRMVPHWA